MGRDKAIDVRNVSKCYRRYSHPSDRLKELILPHRHRGEEFWALSDVSFQVGCGESLGILGQNGSGKSTLLQIITNTLTPTGGTVEIFGKISALLELGSGFNPDFTGRQNVMINGRILGFSQKEVESKLNEIIAFAEIGDFIDQPVHTYSSGMFVRLAFAAAVVWEPEILIIDEALAVGDIFFQQKCFERIKALHKKGVTLLFVSHDVKSVLTLCDRAIVLSHGNLIYLGDAATAVDKYRENYYAQFGGDQKKTNIEKVDQPAIVIEADNVEKSNLDENKLVFSTNFIEKNRSGSFKGLILGVSLTDSTGKEKNLFFHREKMVVSIKISDHLAHISPLNVGFQIRDRLGQIIVGTNTRMLNQDLVSRTSGRGFICQFRFQPYLAPGEYTLAVAIAENQTQVKVMYDDVPNAMAISIVSAEGRNEQGGFCWPDIVVTDLND